MSDNFESSLINLGELSKPATVLVEKISDAVGGIFKPYQMVRVAKAEAQAERIRTEGQIEISDLHRRAFHRFLNEEAIKQKNIEEITQKALPLLDQKSKPNEVEDDWITHFFDRCRLVSDEEMQVLWSKVLAGEANSPNTFSKRTLSFLSNLDKSEADSFTSLCGFIWKTDLGLIPLVFNEWEGIYDNLSHPINILDGIGLLRYESKGFRGEVGNKRITVEYYGKKITIETPDVPPTLQTGRVILTKVGEELAPICGSKPVEGFFEYALQKWQSLGYVLLTGEADSISQGEV